MNVKANIRLSRPIKSENFLSVKLRYLKKYVFVTRFYLFYELVRYVNDDE